MNTAMRVTAIWRHPVKSLQGEPLLAAAVDSDGLRGDRAFGIRDRTTGRILTGRREPRLLFAAASLTADAELHVTLPDGRRLLGTGPETDLGLTEWLGRPVELVEASTTGGATAEYFDDATDDTSPAIEWTMPETRFVDNMPLLLLTTASVRAAARLYPAGTWELRRFRPNLVVDVDGEGWLEDGWCGSALRIGDVQLVPREPCIRCTMVTRPQPGLERDLDIYKTIARHHAGTLGVWSSVQTPGSVRTGDTVEVVA